MWRESHNPSLISPRTHRVSAVNGLFTPTRKNSAPRVQGRVFVHHALRQRLPPPASPPIAVMRGMKSALPWRLKGVRPQARETARAAARDAGMSIGEWLDTVILNSTHPDEEASRRYDEQSEERRRQHQRRQDQQRRDHDRDSPRREPGA